MKNCDHCTVTHCLDCINVTACSICDNANNYFIVNADLSCLLCTIVNCKTCQSLTACQVC